KLHDYYPSSFSYPPSPTPRSTLFPYTTLFRSILWTFFLTMYTIMIAYSKKMVRNPMTPYVIAVILINTIFFYFILGFVTNPFELVSDGVPAEGMGLNPMLQDPGMIIHPVAIYLGYVGLVVPFAFAMASLMLKNMDSFWIKTTRR